MEFHVEDHPDPRDIEVLETQIRREASAAMGLGDEVDLAILVRDAGRIVAGISGWTWGDCCELQSLWVEPSLRGRGLATQLIAAAEAEAAARGCSQTVHFTYAFQARALYERNGYELVGRVSDFPSGTDVLWYHKHLKPAEFPQSPHATGPRWLVLIGGLCVADVVRCVPSYVARTARRTEGRPLNGPFAWPGEGRAGCWRAVTGTSR